MKKFIAVCLTLVLVASLLPAEMFFVFAAQSAETQAYTDYTEISTKEELDGIRNDLTGKYVLTADIEFEEADFMVGGLFYNDGMGWLPIGSDSFDGFSGVLDGNGHTISGLTIRNVADSEKFIGLFGELRGGTVVNLSVTNLSLFASNSAGAVTAGGIAGVMDRESVISGCSVDGAISADGYRSTTVGGIAGTASGTIKSCHNGALVYAASQSGIAYIGGIVGVLAGRQAVITYSYNTGSVEGKDSSGPMVGGIVGQTTGYAVDENDSVMTVSKCYNTGTVTALSSGLPYAAGIVGVSGTQMNISDCYNIGEIRLDSTPSLFTGAGGGIIGLIPVADVTVSACYNAGKLVSVAAKSQEELGGIAGKMRYGTLKHCYYLGETAKAGVGYSETSGSFVDGETVRCSKNDMIMRSTFEGFDFDGVWMMGSQEGNGYPVLLSEQEAQTPKNGLIIYSDFPSLCIPRGDVATFYVRVLKEGKVTDDNSGVAFAAENAYILDMTQSGKEDGIFFVRFKGVSPGMTLITFSDSNTGATVTVPVNVYERSIMYYTIESVPSIPLDKIFGDKTVCNIYNYNGMYVENYQYKIDEENKIANLSFDVYNNSNIYGTVESYYENGMLYDACLIEKTKNLNTSLYDLYIKGSICLVSDIASGNLLSYKQSAAGASTCTHIDISVPKNGYVKICADATDSDLVNIINIVDIALSGIEIAGNVKGFGKVSADFSKDLLQEFRRIKKDAISGKIDLATFFDIPSVNLEITSSALTKDNIWEYLLGICRGVLNSKSLNSFLVKLCGQYQIDVGQDIFAAFSGAAGLCMEAAFAVAKIENYIVQVCDYLRYQNSGSPMIQYNGGEYVTCDRVWVKSESGFGKDVALSAFTISLDDDILSKLKADSPDVYDAIAAGKSYTYNISLIRNQEETQPNGPVSVFIPILDELKSYVEQDKAKVFRVEADGSLTDMDAWAQDGMLTFTTNHFSLYVIVGLEEMDVTQNPEGGGEESLPGDNGSDEDSGSQQPDTGVLVVCLAVAIVAAGVTVWFMLKKKNSPMAPKKAPDTTKRFCSACGAELAKDTKFCGECGSKQE